MRKVKKILKNKRAYLLKWKEKRVTEKEGWRRGKSRAEGKRGEGKGGMNTAQSKHIE